MNLPSRPDLTSNKLFSILSNSCCIIYPLLTQTKRKNMVGLIVLIVVLAVIGFIIFLDIYLFSWKIALYVLKFIGEMGDSSARKGYFNMWKMFI